MSAGSHTYTWLNNDRQPTKLPAIQYITLVQKWVTGKIQDPSIFPTDTRSISEEGAAKFVLGERSAGGGVLSQAVSGGASTHSSSSLSSQTWVGKSSGFPPEFEQVCKNITRQMFRVYAHLYWNHYRAPFYDLSIEKYLNSVFTLFVTMAREYDLLSPKDIEPMQGLIDLWIAQKVFPQDSKVVNFSHPVSTNTASLPSQASTVSPS
ncbi:MAG: hypothetical protein M1829_005776 [Trizodia sp. TS-e1964]|nr:MAG: hypothetical protein M1829_005776 [Trizodia sp. TS-e1964]